MVSLPSHESGRDRDELDPCLWCREKEAWPTGDAKRAGPLVLLECLRPCEKTLPLPCVNPIGRPFTGVLGFKSNDSEEKLLLRNDKSGTLAVCSLSWSVEGVAMSNGELSPRGGVDKASMSIGSEGFWKCSIPY